MCTGAQCHSATRFVNSRHREVQGLHARASQAAPRMEQSIGGLLVAFVINNLAEVFACAKSAVLFLIHIACQFFSTDASWYHYAMAIVAAMGIGLLAFLAIRAGVRTVVFIGSLFGLLGMGGMMIVKRINDSRALPAAQHHWVLRITKTVCTRLQMVSLFVMRIPVLGRFYAMGCHVCAPVVRLVGRLTRSFLFITVHTLRRTRLMSAETFAMIMAAKNETIQHATDAMSGRVDSATLAIAGATTGSLQGELMATATAVHVALKEQPMVAGRVALEEQSMATATAVHVVLEEQPMVAGRVALEEQSMASAAAVAAGIATPAPQTIDVVKKVRFTELDEKTTEKKSATNFQLVDMQFQSEQQCRGGSCGPKTIAGRPTGRSTLLDHSIMMERAMPGATMPSSGAPVVARGSERKPASLQQTLSLIFRL